MNKKDAAEHAAIWRRVAAELTLASESERDLTDRVTKLLIADAFIDVSDAYEADPSAIDKVCANCRHWIGHTCHKKEPEPVEIMRGSWVAAYAWPATEPTDTCDDFAPTEGDKT